MMGLRGPIRGSDLGAAKVFSLASALLASVACAPPEPLLLDPSARSLVALVFATGREPKAFAAELELGPAKLDLDVDAEIYVLSFSKTLEELGAVSGWQDLVPGRLPEHTEVRVSWLEDGELGPWTSTTLPERAQNLTFKVLRGRCTTFEVEPIELDLEPSQQWTSQFGVELGTEPPSVALGMTPLARIGTASRVVREEGLEVIETDLASLVAAFQDPRTGEVFVLGSDGDFWKGHFDDRLFTPIESAPPLGAPRANLSGGYDGETLELIAGTVWPEILSFRAGVWSRAYTLAGEAPALRYVAWVGPGELVASTKYSQEVVHVEGARSSRRPVDGGGVQAIVSHPRAGVFLTTRNGEIFRYEEGSWELITNGILGATAVTEFRGRLVFAADQQLVYEWSPETGLCPPSLARGDEPVFLGSMGTTQLVLLADEISGDVRRAVATRLRAMD